MAEALAAKTYDADYFKSQFDQEAARSTGGGPRTEYLKLTGGQNDLRILPGDPLFAVLRQHGYKSEGRFTSALDYGFVLSNPEVAESAIANGYITGDDIAAAQEFGDPFTKLAETAKQLGVDEKLINTWPRTRYLWNAVDRTSNEMKVLLFESSKTFFDGVTAIFSKAPDLFDPENGRDIGIKGNGRDGIQRRYEAPIADFDQTPVGFDYEDSLIDLNAVVTRKVRPWAEKARAMFEKHGDLAAQVGITPEKWGL